MTTQSQIVSATKLADTEGEFQTGQILTIVGGHFVHDTFSAFVAPLLPLIIEKLSLSLTLAGSLWGFSQLPALLNPFIGYLADRLSLRYFLILAPAVTATMMSLLGVAAQRPKFRRRKQTSITTTPCAIEPRFNRSATI